MTRVRVAAVAAGLTVAMVVGVLVGGALSTANADDDIIDNTGGISAGSPAPWYFKGDDGSLHWAGTPEYERLLAERDAPAERGAAEEAEAVTCSLVDGCTVNVVDADGEVVKVMTITFSDPKDADSAEVTLE